MKDIVTVTGIRPDFIRMSEIFKKLDNRFKHTLIHTGQHYDKMLSDVFFTDLDIRQPDHNLCAGGCGREQYQVTAEITMDLIKYLKLKNLNPDLILFLGDSNSVACSMALKKEGYTIGHIEAGMRSYDKRMLEEVNRTVCDHCSEYHFVYHQDYADNLTREGLNTQKFVVGNTIVEPCNKILETINVHKKQRGFILLDIHRPENFKYKHRLENLLTFADYASVVSGLPVLLVKFPRTMQYIQDYKLSLNNIIPIDLMSYKSYIKMQYNAKFIISDSGTAQEEPALLDTPVLVPRDYTERPQSVAEGCSLMVNVNNIDYNHFSSCIMWAMTDRIISKKWLGDGTTSEQITKILEKL